jgi:hypothetical protein
MTPGARLHGMRQILFDARHFTLPRKRDILPKIIKTNGNISG